MLYGTPYIVSRVKVNGKRAVFSARLYGRNNISYSMNIPIGNCISLDEFVISYEQFTDIVKRIKEDHVNKK